MDFDIKNHVYKRLGRYIRRLRYRRLEGFSEASLESQYLIARIKEFWYWRDRLNKSHK